MFQPLIDNLQRTIQWARCDNDLMVLQQARRSMQQLQAVIAQLDRDAQRRANQTVDALLPMEWPLWMEACRFEDEQPSAAMWH